jgi:hypothetical protein
MEKEEMERKIDELVTKGQMPTGLYDAGLAYVMVAIVGDDVICKWFDRAENITDYISN